MKKRSSIILIFALFIASTFSIYEDEIIHTDWYRENIGEVQTAFFRNTDSLLVSTAESVIASLDPKSGNLNWRQVLPNNETLVSFTSNSNYAFSLSHLSGSVFLRLFDSGTGSLHWDVSQVSSPVVSTLLTDTQVILLSPQYIQVRSLLSGNTQWQITNKKSKAIYGYVEDSLLYVTEITGDTAELKAYQLSSGTVKEEKNLGKFNEISQVVYVKNHVIFNADKIYVHRLTSKSNTVHNTQETAKSLSTSADNTFLILQGQSATQLVKVNDEKFETVYSWKKSLPASSTSTSAVTATSSSSLEFLNLLNKNIQSISFSQLEERGHVTRLFHSEEYTLLVHQDLTVTMVSKTSLLWQREESLSHITDVKIMEFPSSHVFDTIVHTFDMHSNFIASFLSRVGSHVQQLTEFLTGGKQTEVASSLTKDRFGYRQLILAVTKAGKLFAISTEKGNILWSKFFPGIQIQHIFVTKSVFPLESILIGKDSSRTLLYTFNPLNGQAISSVYKDMKVVQANVLPWEHAVMLVDDKYNVVMYPQNNNNASSLFFYVVDTKETSVKGYSVAATKSVNVWKIPFSEGETIESVHYHPLEEHITAPFKITGDRKALPKYLNRNMVSIATIKGDILNIYIVDTVTGDMIYNTYHTGSCGPVHFISSENWVGYHYWSIENSRYEYSVIELYEKEIDWKATSFSSFSPPEIVAIQQSYVFLHKVTTIGITKTAYGLSTKHLLFGLPTGQIAAISRNFLDARRPAKEQMTQEMFEEGLMAYQPFVSYNKWNVINYYRKISKLREIKTAPAYLESTSLVFAYGLDNFFTLVNPSGPFDVLGVNFNYFGLVATAIGIVGLTIVFVYLSKKKDLYRRWE